MKAWTDALRVFGMAWLVALVLLIPTFLGLAIDRYLGTSPWALLAGALLAIIVASAGFTFAILRRYDELAPPSKEPE